MADVHIHEVDDLRLGAPTDAEGMFDAYGRPPGDRRLPYWARLWPSGVVLSRLVTSELAPRLKGKRVIELGCGLAAAGLAAARAGANVTLTDREHHALAVAVDNARRNGVQVATEQLAWERIPDPMVGRFDFVLGSDIAYDRAQIAPLVGAIQVLLAPGGEAWITEPGRLGPTVLRDAATAAGLDAVLVRTAPHPSKVITDDDFAVDDIDIVRMTLRSPG